MARRREQGSQAVWTTEIRKSIFGQVSLAIFPLHFPELGHWAQKIFMSSYENRVRQVGPASTEQKVVQSGGLDDRNSKKHIRSGKSR